MRFSRFRQRLQLVLAGVLLTLLLSAVFTLGSLRVPFEPSSWRELLALWAVSSFITAALLVFSLILSRTLLRLLAERKKDQLGARFKTKMVLGATALSLLPVLVMFFVSYALLNRTLARWFPRPLEIAAEQSRSVLNEMSSREYSRLSRLAGEMPPAVNVYSLLQTDQQESLCRSADAYWLADQAGKMGPFYFCWRDWRENEPVGAPFRQTDAPKFLQKLSSGGEIWMGEAHRLFLAGRSKHMDGTAQYAAREVPADFLSRLNDIEKQNAAYEQEKQNLRAFKKQMLLILSLFTLLLFFAFMWLALFLAKQVTVPIQALAEGTRELKAGNFDYQVPEQAHDELGVLVRSFNTMTTQLRDSRAQIDQFTRNLQQAVQELERRRQLMETVLENIPTGVISVGAGGEVLRSNAAIGRMFGSAGRDFHSIPEMFGEDAARAIQQLMRRALRMGVASRELEMPVTGRMLHAAVTVSSLGPRRANTGFVLVFDDLTELLRAQKSAAWQEVARRIAHEIKNPLTPIQLSAQRLSRYIERRDAAEPGDSELTRLVQECSRLIEREVGTLSALVNEFSQFVRFPSARLEPLDVNTIVREAVEIFSGRLDGIHLTTSLPDSLPAVRADASLLRSVVVNLIDNAAEALESSSLRNIRVATHFNSDSDSVEIAVEDTGHGISPQDKDKLFLPHFSTKDRGTGLGLAIAARIVSEHNGAIRVEDGHPVGSRFLIELPISDPVLSSDRPAHVL